MIERFVSALVKQGCTTEENRELVIYGLRQGIHSLLNMVTCLLMGAGFGVLLECMVFFVLFSVLRLYTGGYHANTALRCYSTSVLVYAAVFWTVATIRLPYLYIFLCGGIVSLMIWFMAPVMAVNKPLEEMEIIVYRHRTRMTVCAIWMLYGLFGLLGMYQICMTITAVIVVDGMLLILGILKLKGSLQENRDSMNNGKENRGK